MNLFGKLAPALVLAAMTGCATLPTGPSVNVMPAQGKPFEKFQEEDATCRQWADRQLGAPTQETYDKNVATGAVAGTAIGAGLGAAIGSASGHAGAGAAIGAASGLLFGTAAGSGNAQAYGREAQRRYDNAYVQCMYSYGNQVPAQPQRRRVVAAPPPPPPPPVVMAPPPPPPPVMVAAAPPAPPMADPYPAPEEIYVQQAPEFVYSPALSMYVAVGVPYDLLYNGRDYFYYYRGYWFRGPFYDGPWTYMPRRAYPPAFVSLRIDFVRHHRDLEYRRYQHDRGHYDGRLHRPAFRERRNEQHDHH